ncbi:ferric reductase-like transmembrane domain-containing protein [Candidatus Woesearchaeota archaeon]|nr:ferric reductase-like transmembrane domain-containing protein [Candidatus Woesearchaeota archaeon]
MKFESFLGWTFLFLLCVTPVFLLMAFGDEPNWFGNYETATHTLGEIFGLVGMTMFALTFLLSTRVSFIEDIFGGLDKVYIAHGILGGSALILILFHPVLLVLKFIPNDVWQAALYLLPSAYWSVNFGIIALVGMVLLIVLTLFSKLKYHNWKLSHDFFGLVFLFAVLHVFLIRGNGSKDMIFAGYYIYAAVVAVIGFSGFFYSMLLKTRLFKNAIYTVADVVKYKDYFEVILKPEHKPISYKSGQFVFLRFYNQKLSSESHPFSIASKSDAPNLTIVIKKLGDYTSALDNLKLGDKVGIEGPYGRFNYRGVKTKTQVWIAGGIGITPFLGMVMDLLEGKGLEYDVDLYYCVNNDADFIGANIIQKVAEKNKRFRYFAWNTKKYGHLGAQNIAEFSGKFKGKDFFLCGPPPFKESVIKSLEQSGVSDSYIHEEAFDFI